MKLSKLMHILSVIMGVTGIIVFIGAVIGGSDNVVFGITKFDALACAGIIIFIAIWLGIGTIHHVIIEQKGEIL